jgi:flagellar biogenesis protein FliO
MRPMPKPWHSPSSWAAWLMLLLGWFVSLAESVGLAQNMELRSATHPGFATSAQESTTEPAIVRPMPRSAGGNVFEAGQPTAASIRTSPTPEVQKASYQTNNSSSIPFRSTTKSNEDTKLKKPTSGWSSTLSMLVSLGLVIVLFLGLARFLKTWSPALPYTLPKDVVRVVGRTPLGPRQQMYLIRFGGKLLLVSQQLGQTTTLSEIEHPDEVAHLLGLCEQAAPSSISQSFRDVLHHVATSTTRRDAASTTLKSSVVQSRSHLDSLG